MLILTHTRIFVDAMALNGCPPVYYKGQFSSQKFGKIFKIFRHIESLDACMKH